MELININEFSGKHLSDMIREQGPQIACDHLHCLYSERIRYKAFYILKKSPCHDPREHAKEIRQQTFVEVKKDFDKFLKGEKPDYTNPRAWADTICRNLCLDHIDEYNRAKMIAIEDATALDLQNNRITSDGLIISSAFDNPEQQLENKEFLQIAFRLLSQLDEEKQLIVRMRLYEDMSYLEISTFLGLSEISARQKYSRALRELKKKYEAGGK